MCVCVREAERETERERDRERMRESVCMYLCVRMCVRVCVSFCVHVCLCTCVCGFMSLFGVYVSVCVCERIHPCSLPQKILRIIHFDLRAKQRNCDLI